MVVGIESDVDCVCISGLRGFDIRARCFDSALYSCVYKSKREKEK